MPIITNATPEQIAEYIRCDRCEEHKAEVARLKEELHSQDINTGMCIADLKLKCEQLKDEFLKQAADFQDATHDYIARERRLREAMAGISRIDFARSAWRDAGELARSMATAALADGTEEGKA